VFDSLMLATSFHAADQTGIVVITQMHPISVVFTLPEQNLQELLNQDAAKWRTEGCCARPGETPPSTLDEGALAVVDNEIDQTTGTLKLKATFPNDQLQLWPGNC